MVLSEVDLIIKNIRFLEERGYKVLTPSQRQSAKKVKSNAKPKL